MNYWRLVTRPFTVLKLIDFIDLTAHHLKAPKRYDKVSPRIICNY